MKTLLKFKCDRCNRIFDAEGTKEEWRSPIYGPCYDYKAPCPSCGVPVKEYRPRLKARSSEESFGDESSGEGPCGGGGEAPYGEGPPGSDFGGFEE